MAEGLLPCLLRHGRSGFTEPTLTVPRRNSNQAFHSHALEFMRLELKGSCVFPSLTLPPPRGHPAMERGPLNFRRWNIWVKRKTSLRLPTEVGIWPQAGQRRLQSSEAVR